MGCIFGKDEPAAPKKDRVRVGSTPASPYHARASVVGADKSQPQGIAVNRKASRLDAPGVNHLSKSPTDRHDEEFDEIRTIVENTQHNFIDVAQKPSAMDEKDAEERMRRYQNHLQNITQRSAATSKLPPVSSALAMYPPALAFNPASLFSLPPSIPSLDPATVPHLVETLRHALQPLPEEDRELLISTSNAVSAAIAEMKVVVPNDLIVSTDTF